MIACQDPKRESDTQVNNLTDTPQQGGLSLKNYTPIFQSILKNEDGMARGVTIGDKFDAIQETTLPSETQPDNGRSYTEYFDNTDLNFADILYTKDSDNKVSEISIDVYIEKQVTVDSLISEFKSYFEKKYGKGVEQEKATTWDLSEGKNTLILQNVSTQKDPGFKIVFSIKPERNPQ